MPYSARSRKKRLHTPLRVEELESRSLLDSGLGQLAAAGCSPAQFATRLYQDLLQRAPQASEVSGWVSDLNGGLAAARIAQAFVESPEYTSRLIGSEYTTLLGRSADQAGISFWQGQMQAGVTPEQMAAAFVGADEYYQGHAGTPATWLDGVYHDLLGRLPDASGAASWTHALAGGVSLQTVGLDIAQSAEAHARVVSSSYLALLQRQAESAALDYWTSVLAKPGLTSLLPALLASTTEYFHLAAQTTPPPSTGGTSGVQFGVDASLGGQQLFPADNPWNQDVSQAPVDANSNNLIASIGLNTGLHPDFGTTWDGAPNGIPYMVVPGTQPKVAVSFKYSSESDPGPYPIPANAPIEGGPNSTGDRHVLILDRDNWKLYELYAAYPLADGTWHADSGAIFDLHSNALRPAGWTSADAAGLPILPGLVRYDEVMEQGVINHALRFTVGLTRRAFLAPATHYASSLTSPDLPPMGMRVRLKANVDISSFPAPVRVILTALKKYGMMVADNGGNWFISGAPDPRWDDSVLATIREVQGSEFEVVQMNGVITG